jgi:hypothetical protein
MSLQENLRFVREIAFKERVDEKWFDIFKQSIDEFKLYEKFKTDLSEKGYVRDKRII